jgi:hypothetical protein
MGTNVWRNEQNGRGSRATAWCCAVAGTPTPQAAMAA